MTPQSLSIPPPPPAGIVVDVVVVLVVVVVVVEVVVEVVDAGMVVVVVVVGTGLHWQVKVLFKVCEAEQDAGFGEAAPTPLQLMAIQLESPVVEPTFAVVQPEAGGSRGATVGQFERLEGESDV